MNKFIKLPLFLGSVTLVFCTALAVVQGVCQPIIDERAEKAKIEALSNLYSGITAANDVESDLTNYKRIKGIQVITHNSVNSYVYTLLTANPASGTFEFMLGIDKASGKIDAYSMLTNGNPGYSGNGHYDNNSAMLEDLKADNQVAHITGQTKSENVMHEAINEALSHFDANFKGGK